MKNTLFTIGLVALLGSSPSSLAIERTISKTKEGVTYRLTPNAQGECTFEKRIPGKFSGIIHVGLSCTELNRRLFPNNIPPK